MTVRNCFKQSISTRFQMINRRILFIYFFSMKNMRFYSMRRLIRSPNPNACMHIKYMCNCWMFTDRMMACSRYTIMLWQIFFLSLLYLLLLFILLHCHVCVTVAWSNNMLLSHACKIHVFTTRGKEVFKTFRMI